MQKLFGINFNSIFLSIFLIFLVCFSLILANYLFLISNLPSNLQQSSTLIFVILLIFVVLIFVSITKKLYPLKNLHQKVTLLADEQFEFKCCQNDRKDEIGVLCNEFHKSTQKLAKIKNFQLKEIDLIFRALKSDNKSDESLSEIIDCALLFCDSDCKKPLFEDKIIAVNRDLFIIMFANLIKIVEKFSSNNTFWFELSEEICFVFESFEDVAEIEENLQKSLEFLIIQNITDWHEFDLRYEASENNFKFFVKVAK